MFTEKHYVPKNITNGCLVEALEDVHSLANNRAERFAQAIFEKIKEKQLFVKHSDRTYLASQFDLDKVTIDEKEIVIIISSLTTTAYIKTNIVIPIQYFVNKDVDGFIEYFKTQQ